MPDVNSLAATQPEDLDLAVKAGAGRARELRFVAGEMLESTHQLGARPASPYGAVGRVTGGRGFVTVSSVGSGTGLGGGSGMLATVGLRVRNGWRLRHRQG